GRRERGRGDRLADPAGWRVPETLVAPEGSDGPAPGVGRHSAHVLTHQNGKDTVGGTLGRRTGFVADGGPPLAIVGGDLETVGGADHRGVALHHNARGRDVLPLRPQLIVGPVFPGLPS